ncbi:conserved exported hypothetical protein [Tenacibaculum litopenaei]|jgi:hypothetical protein|uniref:hypothetical protein n=1 Tax=Tenacibaculum litopenaei TaxID=396016 RepID=UPI003895AFA0
MTKPFLRVLVLIIMAISTVSCVQELDFDQADSIVLKPTFTASLAFTKLDQTSFVNAAGVEVRTITDKTRFELFENSAADEMEKIDIDFEITNPFNRRFTLDFRFLDDADNETYRLNQLAIAENVKDFKHREEILLTPGASIFGSRKIEVTLTLIPSTDGSIININERKIFTFKSAGTFYFNID